jgi:hypothetical protein
MPSSFSGHRDAFVAIPSAPGERTEECIWSTGPDGIGRGADDEALFDLARDEDIVASDVFPLTAISDTRRLSRLKELCSSLDDPERREAWDALRRRILEPLQRLIATCPL